MDEDDAGFLRAQAKKCRWLAERINSRDVVKTLHQMAEDYDARAGVIEARQPPPEAA